MQNNAHQKSLQHVENIDLFEKVVLIHDYYVLAFHFNNAAVCESIESVSVLTASCARPGGASTCAFCSHEPVWWLMHCCLLFVSFLH